MIDKYTVSGIIEMAHEGGLEDKEMFILYTDHLAEIAKKDEEIVWLKEELDVKCKDCNRLDAFDENTRLCEEVFDLKARIKDLEEVYSELIMAVEQEWEGETLHQTALKYIRMADTINGMIAKKALKEKV